ncbi:flavin-binding monooxygenase-like domain-containing protein [Hirsutella rhossiliensis]|uniref:Flavin-binding monooxygenase-like domain-containing protein n=1 Tax=Hirsutella rhossiliensis TaxID=111463 RepID=A0A9P8MX62_9HYPO|nr:flavin-binding monooxygenase-like domain-containing protein [Hirsutella rhossiliensis]KAH0962865.1 flavin-binding monooxygenase-like domain-containing protein [Hirsutella rhossiliensis]
MDSANMGNVKIAVIGLGPAGLTAIKALREEGFDVVGFERRDRVGGIWAYSPNPNYTSVIHDTVSNVSKFVSGFSDFPILKEYPPYMTGTQVAEYFEEYARHFQLEQHVRFKTTVRRVLRDELDRGWNVHVSGPEGDAILHFDKVVLGSGSDSVPSWPPMPGRQLFKGTVIHGQSYRRPEQFAGKRVLVVGIGNTACEVSLSLTSHASKVYQSYRRGRIIVSRYFDNDLLDYKLPWLAHPLGDRAMKKSMIHVAARRNPQDLDPKGLDYSARDRRKLAAEKIKGDWRLVPCASMAHVHPVVQERFIPALLSGQIAPARGFKAFTGAHEVLLDDGSTVEVDAVIFCTGYALEFDIMPELEMDGTEPHLPRLYHMIFPPRWASSVAVLSWMSPLETYWCVCDLASMAVAQAWSAETAKEKGLAQIDGYRRPALLPSEAKMNAEVDRYHTWWRRDMAGTGMFDNIDHVLTLRGWRLKRKDRELHMLLSQGPANSYAWRIFDTNPKGIPGCGRKAWPGARQAVQDAYDDYQKYKRDIEDEKLRRQVMFGG